jgi:hypothetical protein
MLLARRDVAAALHFLHTTATGAFSAHLIVCKNCAFSQRKMVTLVDESDRMPGMSATRGAFFLIYVACVSANVDVLNEILKGGVERAVYPGTVAVVGNVQGPLYSDAVGHHSYDKSDTVVKAETLFDLASLT